MTAPELTARSRAASKAEPSRPSPPRDMLMILTPLATAKSKARTRSELLKQTSVFSSVHSEMSVRIDRMVDS